MLRTQTVVRRCVAAPSALQQVQRNAATAGRVGSAAPPSAATPPLAAAAAAAAGSSTHAPARAAAAAAAVAAALLAACASPLPPPSLAAGELVTCEQQQHLQQQHQHQHQQQQHQQPQRQQELALIAAAAGAAPEDTMQNVPGQLGAPDGPPPQRLSAIISGANKRAIETCTRKCVPTCVRGGGEGAPGLGPLSVRREPGGVVFKDTYRSRSYCLNECANVCAALSKPSGAQR